MPVRRFNRRQQDAGLKHGWRSGLEQQECERLKARGVNYSYEPFVIRYTPEPKQHRYTPDVLLLDNGILIETKGQFKTADRQKHLSVRAEHPDLDIRFVFSNARQRISKQSQTRYCDWCDHKGFKWAHKQIPDEWLTEPARTVAFRAANKLMEDK